MLFLYNLKVIYTRLRVQVPLGKPNTFTVPMCLAAKQQATQPTKMYIIWYKARQIP
jgi:hypothetical protein